jgi:hypothetical protein
MGKKYPPQAFVGSLWRIFFQRGDGDEELKPGKFPIVIPSLAASLINPTMTQC